MIPCPILSCAHSCQHERGLFAHLMQYHSKFVVVNALVGLQSECDLRCRVCREVVLGDETDLHIHLKGHPKNNLVDSLVKVWEEREEACGNE